MNSELGRLVAETFGDQAAGMISAEVAASCTVHRGLLTSVLLLTNDLRFPVQTLRCDDIYILSGGSIRLSHEVQICLTAEFDVDIPHTLARDKLLGCRSWISLAAAKARLPY
jgi:hypothetical protein